MNRVLTDQLYAPFPRLYRSRYKSKYESAMHWGFDCGDGWYHVLYDLGQELEDYLTTQPNLDCEAVLVKSKFGSLRFPLNWCNAAKQELVSVT